MSKFMKIMSTSASGFFVSGILSSLMFSNFAVAKIMTGLGLLSLLVIFLWFIWSKCGD